MIWVFTNTQEGVGGKEGENKDSQPGQTTGKRENNEGRKQAGEHTTSRRNTGKEGGKVGKGSTQEPNAGTQKSNQRKTIQATKQNTAARQRKQDSTGKEQTHTHTHLRRRQGESGVKRRMEKDGKEKGGWCPNMRAAAMRSVG